jgi:hypothetical protein
MLPLPLKENGPVPADSFFHGSEEIPTAAGHPKKGHPKRNEMYFFTGPKAHVEMRVRSKYPL